MTRNVAIRSRDDITAVTITNMCHCTGGASQRLVRESKTKTGKEKTELIFANMAVFLEYRRVSTENLLQIL
jgi:hypothetical protein